MPLALVAYALAAINTEARPLIDKPLQIRPLGNPVATKSNELIGI
jgi:hypothetical protein